MSRALVPLLVTALAFSARPAPAQNARDQAKESFLRGVDLFNKGELARALPEFEGSYQLNPVPEVLFNIALVYRGMGRSSDAVRALRRFLAETEERTTPLMQKRRSDAQAAIAEIRAHMGVLVLATSPPTAAVRVDGLEPIYDGALIYLDEGARRLEVTAAGYVAAREVLTVTAGKTTTLRLDLRREAAAVGSGVAPPSPAPLPSSPALGLTSTTLQATAPAPRRPVYKRWWVWTTVGVVVVAGVATGLGVGLTQGAGPSTAGAIPVQFPK